ncbi:MAG: restriction endonuclease subunit S, partial [Nostoc sp.]
NKLDPSFLLYLVRFQDTQKRLLGETVGSTVGHLNLNNFKQLEIPIPPLPEQKEIAKILSDMDTEIAGLEQKRDKYKNLKQGMMQELLTGKTRLKSDLDN